MPDSSPTIARREPTIRLNSVDLPTFGRPTMARRGRETVMDEQYPRRDSHPRLSAVMQAVRPAGQPRAGVPTCAVEYYRDSVRSEERRVGKECRLGWWAYDGKENSETGMARSL